MKVKVNSCVESAKKSEKFVGRDGGVGLEARPRVRRESAPNEKHRHAERRHPRFVHERDDRVCGVRSGGGASGSETGSGGAIDGGRGGNSGHGSSSGGTSGSASTGGSTSTGGTDSAAGASDAGAGGVRPAKAVTAGTFARRTSAAAESPGTATRSYGEGPAFSSGMIRRQHSKMRFP
jgi:hypothetical protein